MANYYQRVMIDIELVDRDLNSFILMDGQLAPLEGGPYSVFIRRYVYSHSDASDIWVGTNLVPHFEALHKPHLADIKTGVCTRFDTVVKPWGAIPSGIMWARKKVALKISSIMRLMSTGTEGGADLVAPYLWVEDASGDTMLDVSGRTIKARRLMHYLPLSAGEEYNSSPGFVSESVYNFANQMKYLKLGKLYIGRPAKGGVPVPPKVLTADEATVAYRRRAAFRWFASYWFDEPITIASKNYFEAGVCSTLFDQFTDELFDVANGRFPSYDIDDVL